MRLLRISIIVTLIVCLQMFIATLFGLSEQNGLMSAIIAVGVYAAHGTKY